MSKQDPQRKPFAHLTQSELDDLGSKMERLHRWRRTSGMSIQAFVNALAREGVTTSTTTYRTAELRPDRGMRLLHNKPQVYYAGQRILKRKDSPDL